MTDDARDDEDEEKAQTPEELRATLDEYRASLAEVTEGLRETPEDEELLDLRASLVEVIEITEDVLASTVEASSAREEEEEKDTVDGRAPTGASGRGEDVGGKETRTEATPSSLGGDLRREGRVDARRGRRVATGTMRARDGRWMFGRVSHGDARAGCGEGGRRAHGFYRRPQAAARQGQGGQGEERHRERERERERGTEGGVSRSSRTETIRVDAQDGVRAKRTAEEFRNQAGDDAETRETKRKKLKMFKYKQRQQEIAAEQNQKASSWQSFQATGLKKKKRGMQTNSIFSSKT